MVLLIEQRTFTVKQYYESHSLKYVRDDFIQEFPNSISPSYHTILNLTVRGDYRKEDGDCKECHGMPQQIIMTGTESRAFTHIDISYTSFHSLRIQNSGSNELKLAESPKGPSFVYGFVAAHVVCLDVHCILLWMLGSSGSDQKSIFNHDWLIGLQKSIFRSDHRFSIFLRSIFRFFFGLRNSFACR